MKRFLSNLEAKEKKRAFHYLKIRMADQSNNESNAPSQEQIDEYHEAFALFDSRAEGTIDLNELGTVLRSLGFYPSEKTIQRLRQDYDQMGMIKINFEQFLRSIAGCTNEIENENDIIEAFRVFDKEGQGRYLFLN